MYIRVDDDKTNIEGFSFKGLRGDEVAVSSSILVEGLFRISEDLRGSNYISLYKEDLPNLIKALKAYQQHIGA